MYRIFFISFIFLFSGEVSIFSDYPLIRYTVKSRDPLYTQQQQDVEAWYSGSEEKLPLAIYRYVPRPSEDLFSVAAAFNLSYETLATLNSWDAPGLFSKGTEILIPNIPGIFSPENPSNSWEKNIAKSRINLQGIRVKIKFGRSENQEILFYPGEKFTSTERIRFLGNLFSSPIPSGAITSGFGYRPNPFTGRPSFHPGIDFRAPIGTSVKAARDGTVSASGALEIYGFYVIIDHEGEYQTLYAHLNEILVTNGLFVNAGDIIALSGNSGISTGPHLHFEIRRKGSPLDPARLTSLRE